MKKKKKERKYRNSIEIERTGIARKLSHTFSLDRENKVFDIPLHFEKASDMFCSNADFEEIPKISDDTTDNLLQILSDIPKGYKADISVTVDDYEKWSFRSIMKGIENALFFRHQRYLLENSRKGMKVGILMFVGVSLILILNIGNFNAWWGSDSVTSEIFTYMLDLFGCVLIWESIYGMFVDRSDEIVFEKEISEKVNSIALVDETGKKVLAEEDKEDITSVMNRNRKKSLSDKMLLLSGFSILAFALADILDALAQIGPGMGFSVIFVIMLAGLFSGIIGLLVGLMAIRLYYGKFKANVAGAAITFFMLISIVMNIVTLLMPGLTSERLIQGLFRILVQGSFAFGLILRFSYFIQLNRSERKRKA